MVSLPTSLLARLVASPALSGALSRGGMGFYMRRKHHYLEVRKPEGFDDAHVSKSFEENRKHFDNSKIAILLPHRINLKFLYTVV